MSQPKHFHAASRLRLWIAKPAVWAIAYSCLAIALFTLNPFRFEAYQPSEWWVWRVGLVDVSQNIFLFLPLGILLRHRLGLSVFACLLSGLLLSLSIESAQLFLTTRTSNYVDLLSNSAGALLGALLHRQRLSDWDRARPTLDLALMLIPICWVRSILTLIESDFMGLLAPNAIAAFALLTASAPRSRPMFGVLSIWSLVAFAPLGRYWWKQGVAIAVFALAVHWLCDRLSLSVRKRSLVMLGLNFGLSLGFYAFWIATDKSSSIKFWTNLPWIEALLLGCVWLSSGLGLQRGDRESTVPMSGSPNT